uniref:DNA-processing protein DprA n=1 Tax=Desulfitibacter alkalitolerans TaxID=264641 RepID=UPI001A9A4403
MGARRCTEYGKKVTQEAAAFLAKQDIPVISGMAKGIDGYAHTACLKEGGYTLAFLGNGVDICYPKEHQGLME